MPSKIENKLLYCVGENVVVRALACFESDGGKTKLVVDKLAVPRIGKITGVKSFGGNDFWAVRWGMTNKEVLALNEHVRVAPYGMSKDFPVKNKDKTRYL